ncbi:MAG: hypothetical protein ACUVRA_08830 [Candidatus Bathyarchaeaceae archaeon]
MINKTEVSGYATLFIGVALLAFTFASAYVLLTSNPNITGSSDLVTVFGIALAPLIETCIRIMYLGVMGWIGSLLTIRGVQLLTQLKREAIPEVKPITAETLKTKKTGKISKDKLVE